MKSGVPDAFAIDGLPHMDLKTSAAGAVAGVFCTAETVRSTPASRAR
jgi:hypothetical protein